MNDFEFVQRHPIRVTPDYWFELDEYRRESGEQFLLAHLRIVRWTASVCKQLIREFKLFRTVCSAPLFACPEVADAKWLRFVTLMGWKPLQEVTCENGEQRPLFIHTN